MGAPPTEDIKTISFWNSGGSEDGTKSDLMSSDAIITGKTPGGVDNSGGKHFVLDTSVNELTVAAHTHQFTTVTELPPYRRLVFMVRCQ